MSNMNRVISKTKLYVSVDENRVSLFANNIMELRLWKLLKNQDPDIIELDVKFGADDKLNTYMVSCKYYVDGEEFISSHTFENPKESPLVSILLKDIDNLPASSFSVSNNNVKLCINE